MTNTIQDWKLEAAIGALLSDWKDLRILMLIEAIDKKDEALKDVLKMMDDGLLVRNIEDDDQPDFHLRMLKFLPRLKAVGDAIYLTDSIGSDK